MRQLGAILGLTLALALALGQTASADGIDRTYVVGDEPMAMAVDPTDGRVYVGRSGGGADHLVVIDPSTGQMTTYATTGSPNYLAIDPVHRRLYVSHRGGQVDVFDLTTMTIEATLPIGGAGIAVNPSTQRVYVASATNLWVVDGVTNTVIQTHAASPDESWSAVAIDPLMHHVYVTNIFAYFDGSGQPIYRSLVVLDDRDLSLLKDVRTDLYVRWGIAVDQARHRVYLADNSSSTSSAAAIVDTTSLTLVRSAYLGGATGGVALLPDGVYVTTFGTAYYVLDPDTLAVRRTVSTAPFRPLLLIKHPNGDLYVGGRELTGPDVVAAISFGNHAPAISGTSFTPAVPATNDTLALGVTAMDGDFGDTPGGGGQRDPLTATYEWNRNGVVILGETGPTIDLARSGNGDRGDTITGFVTVSDPEGLTASASRSVVIMNAAPQPSVSLNSLYPGSNDVLTAAATAFDADGDPVTFVYQWSRNGAAIVGATASSLDLATYGDDGDVIDVIVTASDGQGGGATATATAKALIVPTSGTFLYMRSQPGDYVGRGALQLYTSANSKIWGYAGGGSFSARVVQGNFTHNWSMRLDAPFGQILGVGAYPGAVRTPIPSNPPTMDFSGDGRGCNTLTGRFDITQLEYNVYGELMLIDATFEQHCEGAGPALFGRIRMDVPPPTPGVALPPGSITPPTSGNYLYLQSKDWSGVTYENFYALPSYVVTGSLKSGDDFYRGVVWQGLAPWAMLDIAAPTGQALTATSYIRAVDAHGSRGDRPGISLSVGSTSCSAIGEFDIDELVFAPTGELLVLQVTFEEYCNSGPLPRFGRMRVEAPAPRSPIVLPTRSITPPTSGNFLYVNSQPGDFAGQGGESLFRAADSTITSSLSTSGDYLSGWVYQAPDGNYPRWWYVRIAAPPGQALAPGSYVGAALADYRQAGEPGLEVTGSGGQCSTVLGRFDVEEMTFWSNGDVRTFQATFEQHCNYSTAALFGRFRVETIPPVQLGGTIREEGSVTTKTTNAAIAGTVTCSRASTVDLTITLTQTQAKGVQVTSTVVSPISCTTPSASWSQSMSPESGAFKAGSASATVSMVACEPERRCVSTTVTRTVKLNLGK